MKRFTSSFVIMFLLFVFSTTVANGESVDDMEGSPFPIGTIATANATYEGYSSSNVIDKDLKTSWNSSGYIGTLQLSFPAELSISALQISAQARPTTDEDYTVYGLRDGVWMQISEQIKRRVTLEPLVLEPFAIVPGSYDAIKIDIIGGGSWVDIREITYINQTSDIIHLKRMVDGPIYLSWEPLEGVTGYEVKRSETPGGPFATIATVPQSEWPKYRDDESFSGEYKYKSFYYIVTAVNGSTINPYSNVVSLIRPSTPINIRAVAGNSQAMVTWDSVDRAHKYDIYVASSEDGEYMYYGSSTDNKITVTNLVNGSTYYFMIVASNNDGVSAFSSKSSVTPEIQGPPVNITSIDPNKGPLAGGQVVYVYGTNFVQGMTVQFNKQFIAYDYFGSTGIRFRTPVGTSAGAVQVTLTNPGGMSASFDYVYDLPPLIPVPAVSSISPNHGPLTGKTLVYVYGSNFRDGIIATWDGNPLSIEMLDSGMIRFRTPVGALPGPIELKLSYNDNPFFVTNFTYDAPPVIPAPIISSLSSVNGPTAGGTLLYVYGSGFQSGATVTIGSKVLTLDVLDSATGRFRIPAVTSADNVSITTTNPDGKTSNTVYYQYN